MIATYLTERGTTIGLLEQLFGSTTVASTLKTQLMLRQYNFVAVLLLLLWSLSPLGGQGVLRLITVADQRVVAPASVYYLTPNTTSVLIHDPGYVISGIGAVYLSSIISLNSTQNGPQDSWGNIKVPRIESLKDVLPDADGWKVLPEGPPVSYSSLVGVTVANVSARGNSTFVMTSYFELSWPSTSPLG
jgi:hypothetical protein